MLELDLTAGAELGRFSFFDGWGVSESEALVFEVERSTWSDGFDG